MSLARCTRPKDDMSANQLLSRLSRADARLLEPHLEAVDLPVRTQLQTRNKRVEKIYRSPAERAAVLDQVSRAFDTGVNSTPTYIINGQMMGFGPKGSFTIAAIKQALGLK